MSRTKARPVSNTSEPGRTEPLDLLGRRVRALRKRAGLTQSELAEAIGMSRYAIISLETGKHDIGASRLVSLASALEADVSDFFAAE